MTVKVRDRHDRCYIASTMKIDALQRRGIEDLRRKLGVEHAFADIASALPGIPAEAHSASIRLYIQVRQVQRAALKA